MTEQFVNPTPEEARRALEDSARPVVTPADTRLLQRGTIVMSVAVAGLILAIRLTVGDPDAPHWLASWGFGASIALYTALIVLAIWIFGRVKATPRGFRNLYFGSFTVSMLIYFGYIVALVVMDETAVPWGWTVLAAVAAVIPGVLAARAYRSLGR